MPFLVVPNECDANNATIWLAAINENFDPAGTVLQYGSQQIAVNAGWLPFQTDDGTYRMVYQRVTLTGLAPGTNYYLTMRKGVQWLADGSVTTLPERLPNAGQRPFTVLLGSCFYGLDDKMGAVGQTYMQMPNDAKPDIKFLCGDQVYLDNPFWRFIWPRGSTWLQANSFTCYYENWTQYTANGGFYQLLKNNANFFTSDDHEFWNNAPDIGLNVPVYTTTPGQRDRWWRIGRQLFEIFQTPKRINKFRVGALGFCLIDTRYNRGHGGGDFMAPADLETVGQWADSLEGPGVLVIGQPFFSNKGSAKDYSLPDFVMQYETLKAHLRRSKHSIVILTGDVHYGRIAWANLRPELGTSLIEVISSPMQVVMGAPGSYEPAPQVFGEVWSKPEFSFKQNHFLTLEFTAPSPQRASMLVKFWPIITNGSPVQSQILAGGAIELI